MRIFVAGATGAVGRSLVPQLRRAGHTVIGTTRTPEKAAGLRAMGAEPVVTDALDGEQVRRAVLGAEPDVIVHQMTAIGEMKSFRQIDTQLALTNRLRVEGTRHLIKAAREVAVKHLVVQSFTGWPNARAGGRVKTEDDPLDSDPVPDSRETLAAIRALEEMTLAARDLNGTALRYGAFYGPGTALAKGTGIVAMIEQRKFPIVGGGSGVWSFLHIDDAAAATVAAIERSTPGVYNVVDDEPAEVAVWLPELAGILGAPPPRRLPAWVGRLALGGFGYSMMTAIRGSSNARFRETFGWKPRFATWRQGFRDGL